jgi:hypothetical protein
MANQPAKEPTASDLEEMTKARAWEVMARQIGAMAEASPIEAFDIASIVIDQIASASTPEEIFAANESGPADAADYLNQRLGLLDARFSSSAEKYRKGTLGYYVVLDALDPNGEKVTISCGAPNVVASVFRLYQLNLFEPSRPFWITLRGRETPNGTLYTVHAG